MADKLFDLTGKTRALGEVLSLLLVLFLFNPGVGVGDDPYKNLECVNRIILYCSA